MLPIRPPLASYQAKPGQPTLLGRHLSPAKKFRKHRQLSLSSNGFDELLSGKASVGLKAFSATKQKANQNENVEQKFYA